MKSLRPRVNGGDVIEEDGRIAVSASTSHDGMLSAIIKWIPIEVIGVYEGATVPFGTALADGLVYVMAGGLVATALWTAFATENAKAQSRIAWRQVLLACVAFLFWVVGTTSVDTWKLYWPWWHPGINPAVLAVGTFALPVVDGILRRLGVPQD